MKKLITILLLTLLLNTHFATNANAKGSVIKTFIESIVKFLRGGAKDSIKGSNKTLDDALKRMGQNPEETMLSKTDKTANLKTLIKDESLILEGVGSEKHSNNYLAVNSDKIKPLKERRWLREIFEEGAEEGIQEISEQGFQETAEKGLSNLTLLTQLHLDF